ncbi:MAG: glyoxalase [Lachnospiraceae bacterium]|nr:glyoxalase [Lachnospiraceae bacterium]
MHMYDDKVLDVFLRDQKKLFDEPVAETRQEANDFLEELMAVVVGSADEVREYFEEEGVDFEAPEIEDILKADEVFEIGDGRYLIVEG